MSAWSLMLQIRVRSRKEENQVGGLTSSSLIIMTITVESIHRARWTRVFVNYGNFDCFMGKFVPYVTKFGQFILILAICDWPIWIAAELKLHSLGSSYQCSRSLLTSPVRRTR
jgi:hypothetical protein